MCMISRKPFSGSAAKCGLLLLFLYLAYVAIFAAASSPPNVTLASPESNKVFNTTNNITFTCNATDDGIIRKLELYTNINGSFSQGGTSCFGELCPDSSTALLMHFNNDSLAGENDTVAYDWSGNGNNATVTGALFNASGGKFGGAFEFDGTNKYITVEDSNKIDLSPAGSVELWFYVRNLLDTYILAKAPYDGIQCGKSAYAIKIGDGGFFQLFLGQEAESFNGGIVTANIWQHGVVTWNETNVAMYLNGVKTYSGTHITNSQNNYWLWIGKAVASDCAEFYFNGAIDELALYNRRLTDEEVSEHYNRTLVNNATKNWTVKNVADGTYLWNCRTQDNESQAGWASANRTFYVDLATLPAINSITLSPNSTDDVDPGVALAVTANISDPSGVDRAVFQYKAPAGSFTNVTMALNSSSGLFNASFTPNVNGIWRYRIWSNDTLGNSGTGNETNLSVEYDYTWSLLIINNTGNYSEDLGRKYAPKLANARMGVLVINNTGDSALNFDLSAIPNIAAYNKTEPFDVDPKTAEFVEINATAPETVSEYPLQITVSSDGATPAQRVANGTLISYIGGPQFVVSIETYSSSPEQSRTVNLSAKIRNIGNETATGVWLNWTLPNGWGVVDGNASKFLGNLTSDSAGWNNLQVSINPQTAASGITNISVSASSSENTNGSDSKVVGISCSATDNVCGKGCTYLSDTDCPAPAAASGGGSAATTILAGGGGPKTIYAQKYGMKMNAPQRIDDYRGRTATFGISLSNPEAYSTIENIALSIAGYPQVHISVKPDYMPVLNYAEIKQFEVSIAIPNYTKYGEYNLQILAKGTGRSSKAENTTQVRASGQTIFAVHSSRENETLSALGSAEYIVGAMQQSNITAKKAREMLDEAKAALIGWEYDRARELAENVIATGNLAFRSYGLIAQAGRTIDEAEKWGVQAQETKKMNDLAKAAFAREDYERALQRANDALLTASIETTGKVTMKRALSRYSWMIAGSLLVSLILIGITYRRAALLSIERKIRRLDTEEASMKKVAADAKKGYFESRIITKAEYYKAMYDFERHAAAIRNERKRLILKKAGMTSAKKEVEALEKEEERLRNLMKEEQRKYFEQRNISGRSYKNAMHDLKGELAEIRMQVETVGGAMNKSGSKALVPVILLFAIFFSCAAAAAGSYITPLMGDKDAALEAIMRAEGNISEMQNAHLGTAFANDTLSEAKLLYSQENYIGAESLAKYVEVIKKTALETGKKIDDTEALLYDAEAEGINVSEARQLFDAGIKAFEAEDYVAAENLLAEATNSAEQKRADASMKSALEKSMESDIIGALKAKKKEILAFFGIAAAGSAVMQLRLNAARAKKKKQELSEKITLAKKMMARIQKEYFESGAISRSDYEAGMKKYRAIVLAATRELAILQNRKTETKTESRQPRIEDRKLKTDSGS